MAHNTREEFESVFGFTKKYTVISYVPKPRKTEYNRVQTEWLCTGHHNSAISVDSEVRKPEMITDYNVAKIEVGLMDQLARMFSEVTCEYYLCIYLNSKF